MGLPEVWNNRLYNANLRMQVQQEGSLLKNTVYLSPDGFKGEYKFVDSIGKGEMHQVVDRLGQTQWEEPDARRRRIAKALGIREAF